MQTIFEMRNFEHYFIFITDYQRIPLNFAGAFLIFNRTLMIILVNYLIFDAFSFNRIINTNTK